MRIQTGVIVGIIFSMSLAAAAQEPALSGKKLEDYGALRELEGYKRGFADGQNFVWPAGRSGSGTSTDVGPTTFLGSTTGTGSSMMRKYYLLSGQAEKPTYFELEQDASKGISKLTPIDAASFGRLVVDDKLTIPSRSDALAVYDAVKSLTKLQNLPGQPVGKKQ